MKPIRDIAEITPSNVLYHSAFGFARVDAIGDGHVDISWEKTGPNLPSTVSPENLRRVYTLCVPAGFFERAFNEPDAVRELLQVDPPEGAALLLQELPGAQSKADLADWVTGRNLMSPRAFSRWWEDLLPMVSEDPRFIVDADTICLVATNHDKGPHDQLANPNLSPGRRLDIALAHRIELGEEAFRVQAILAWRTGPRQVRDLAMAALREHHPHEVLSALLAPGPDNVDALIHAIRRAGWDPEQFGTEIHQELLGRIREAAEEGGPMDAEGRLAAAIARWGVPGAVRLLASMADTPNGQRLLYATFAALPPRRVQDLALDMLDELLGRGHVGDGAQWIGRTMLMQAQTDHWTLADQLDGTRTRIVGWLKSQYIPYEDVDPPTDEVGHTTMEIELEPLESAPVLLSDLPPRPGGTFIDLGIALARALSNHHNNGRVVHPSRWNVKLRMDGSVDIPPVGLAEDAPRPVAEAPSQVSDLHAAGVLLIEALIGRTWPRNIQADRVLPYLRHLAPDLPRPRSPRSTRCSIRTRRDARPTAWPGSPTGCALQRPKRSVTSWEWTRACSSTWATTPTWAG